MKRITPGKPGQALTWKWLNSLAEAANAFLGMAVERGCGLTLRRTPAGTILGLKLPRMTAHAFAGPDGITARAGTMVGAGTARLWANVAGTLVDTLVDVPVVNAFADAVAADDYVQLVRIDGVWNVDCPCCMGGYVPTPAQPCSPCNIPKADLHLSFTYAKLFGGTATAAVVLAYTPNGAPPSDAWVGSVTLSDYGSGSQVHTFTMSCSGGGTDLFHSWTSGGTVVGTSEYLGSGDGTGVTAFSSNCSPFSLDWTTTGYSNDRHLVVTE